jgi:transcriptional regulator with XRE-family HTH domain
MAKPGTANSAAMRYVAGMVTRIHRRVLPRLYLREHREAQGLSAERMAERLGIGRESLYRLEREPRRLNPEKQAQYADALGIEPAALWRPPGTPSLDSLVAGQPDEVQAMAADIVRRLVNRG